jgi:tetratricopeptide (TPR) repeat protein
MAGGATDADVTNGAFVAALLAGHVAEAARLAPQGDDADANLRQLGALTRAIAAMTAGKPKDAYAVLSQARFEGASRAAGALLTPLAADAAGVREAAVVRPDPKIDRVVQYFGQLSQSQVFERQKRYDEAETGYKLIAGPQAPTRNLFLLDYGAFLERRGRRADALALYDEALSAGRSGVELTAARARAARRGRPPALPTPLQEMSRVLAASAAIHAASDDDEGALAYLRLALAADPKRLEAWLLVGDLLADQDADLARAAYAHVDKGSDLYVQALTKTAWSYQTAGDKDQALATARAAHAAEPASRDAAVSLAELLSASDRKDEAIGLLDGLIAREGDKADWRLLYLRGTTLADAGRTADSERDLQAALAKQPDDPELLNYLGYMWIDRGVNLPQAMDMVKRAVAQRPRSGAMVDSLGWAYYRLGDYKNALTMLERAVRLEPADPDVNDHLGDAYWRVGRQVEARFQWSRVLTLQPSDAQRQRVDAKLKDGLEASAARPAAAQPMAAKPASAAPAVGSRGA